MKIKKKALKEIITKLCLITILIMLSGCLPIPQLNVRLELPELLPKHAAELLDFEYVTVEGFPEVNTPERYNKTFYQRYFIKGNEAETIVVLEPGIYGGVGSLDLVARQMVLKFTKLEVWILDRRANALEDRSAFLKSRALNNPYPAFDYYIRDEGTETGFNVIPPEELGFMRFWGLEVHLRDMHEVVLRANDSAETVILGGHSLGASIVGFYAAFDFGFSEEEVGYQFIDGLFLIDGALGRTGGFDREPEGLGLGPLEFIPGAQGLREGRGSPYLTFGLSPQFLARREVLGLLAHYRPDELAPEGLYNFPLTNLAAFAINEDDEYSPSTVFSSSWGQATNAKFSGNLAAFLLSGTEAARNRTVTGVAEGSNFVDWSQGDSTREFSNAQQVAAISAQAFTNSTEWYFPIRYLIDIAEQDIRFPNRPFVPASEVTTPTLAVGAGRGLAQNVTAFMAYQNTRPGSAFSSFVLPGLTHFDITQTENNEAVTIFKLWFDQLK